MQPALRLVRRQDMIRARLDRNRRFRGGESVLDWWIDLPPLLKYGAALLVLAVSAVAWIAGYFWPFGWGVGVVLLLAAMCID